MIFKHIDFLFKDLLWRKRGPSIKLSTLQRHKESGGLQVPYAQLYYMATQLQQVGAEPYVMKVILYNVFYCPQLPPTL